LKVVLADGFLASSADTVFGFKDGAIYALDAWLGLLAFSAQIFCDFAGYSTCAIGAALCLGFILPDNFRSPYAAVGFSDFWNRWHMSLSSWLRDYLYIQMGGSRKGRTMKSWSSALGRRRLSALVLAPAARLESVISLPKFATPSQRELTDPIVEFTKRLPLSVGNKDRVIPEAVCPPRCFGESSRTDAFGQIFVTVADKSKDRSKLGSPSSGCYAPHFGEEFFVILNIGRLLSRVPCRSHAGAHIQIEDFNAGIVGQCGELRMPVHDPRFAQSVLVKRHGIFHQRGDIRNIMQRENLERQTLEERFDLFDLVLVVRG